MTETARMADIVLPATMFLEHDDIYTGGGHQYVELAQKLIDAAGRVPHQPRGHLRARRAASARSIRGFDMSPREFIDGTLRDIGWGTLDELEP